MDGETINALYKIFLDIRELPALSQALILGLLVLVYFGSLLFFRLETILSHLREKKKIQDDFTLKHTKLVSKIAEEQQKRNRRARRED